MPAERPPSFSLSPGGTSLLLWNRAGEALVRVPVAAPAEQVVVLDKPDDRSRPPRRN